MPRLLCAHRGFPPPPHKKNQPPPSSNCIPAPSLHSLLSHQLLRHQLLHIPKHLVLLPVGAPWGERGMEARSSGPSILFPPSSPLPPRKKSPTLGAPGAGAGTPIQHLGGEKDQWGGTQGETGDWGNKGSSLSLAELPFMKMKLRMTMRRPSLAVCISLWQKRHHRPKKWTWRGKGPLNVPPTPETSTSPLTVSGSPPRHAAGCW